MSKQDIKEAIERAVRTMQLGQSITRVQLFGSHLHGDAREDSDVDLLIDLEKSARISLFDLVDIQDSFAKELGKKADVGLRDSLNKFIRDEVLAEAETMYER